MTQEDDTDRELHVLGKNGEGVAALLRLASAIVVFAQQRQTITLTPVEGGGWVATAKAHHASAGTVTDALVFLSAKMDV